MTGVNWSSDLPDPSSDIPRGTFCIILTILIGNMNNDNKMNDNDNENENDNN